jgi:hypothetical protein
MNNVFVDHLPKSGREPEEVLNYCDVGQRAILQAAIAIPTR